MKIRSFIAVLATTVIPALALAWTSNAPFKATVHDHEFKRVESKNAGCTVSATLRFSAPASAYEEPAKVRNHYRFKARVKFASGKKVLSPTFFSRQPGNHKFEFGRDTRDQGCWGRDRQKVIGVDVEGCRGKGCRVSPFQ